MAIETKRGYITKEEVEAYCDIAITDEAESIERLNMAEDIIDTYVGFQNSFMRYEIVGTASSGSTTSLVDTNTGSPVNSIANNILSHCVLEIIGGTNAGQSRTIISNNTLGSITVESAFTNAIDNTSVYRIYQLAKFPRTQGHKVVGNIYYKFIPEQVKNACLAQVQYMVEMGDDFFTSGVDKETESMEGYSSSVVKGTRRIIAPKAREYLHGIMNRKGTLIY